MDINFSDIKKLVKLLENSEVSELTLTQGEESIQICRGASNQVTYMAGPSVPVQMAAGPAVVPAAAPVAESEATLMVTDHVVEESGHVVKSPMVGTFYGASSPDVPPFVKMGQKVNAGETLCIIEAMKMMNEIEADVSGTVFAVLVNDATPVEFDQPLFIIQE